MLFNKKNQQQLSYVYTEIKNSLKNEYKAGMLDVTTLKTPIEGEKKSSETLTNDIERLNENNLFFTECNALTDARNKVTSLWCTKNNVNTEYVQFMLTGYTISSALESATTKPENTPQRSKPLKLDCAFFHSSGKGTGNLCLYYIDESNWSIIATHNAQNFWDADVKICYVSEGYLNPNNITNTDPYEEIYTTLSSEDCIPKYVQETIGLNKLITPYGINIDALYPHISDEIIQKIAEQKDVKCINEIDSNTKPLICEMSFKFITYLLPELTDKKKQNENTKLINNIINKLKDSPNDSNKCNNQAKNNIIENEKEKNIQCAATYIKTLANISNLLDNMYNELGDPANEKLNNIFNAYKADIIKCCGDFLASDANTNDIDTLTSKTLNHTTRFSRLMTGCKNKSGLISSAQEDICNYLSDAIMPYIDNINEKATLQKKIGSVFNQPKKELDYADDLEKHNAWKNIVENGERPALNTRYIFSKYHFTGLYTEISEVINSAQKNLKSRDKEDSNKYKKFDIRRKALRNPPEINNNCLQDAQRNIALLYINTCRVGSHSSNSWRCWRRFTLFPESFRNWLLPETWSTSTKETLDNNQGDMRHGMIKIHNLFKRLEGFEDLPSPDEIAKMSASKLKDLCVENGLITEDSEMAITYSETPTIVFNR